MVVLDGKTIVADKFCDNFGVEWKKRSGTIHTHSYRGPLCAMMLECAEIRRRNRFFGTKKFIKHHLCKSVRNDAVNSERETFFRVFTRVPMLGCPV